MNEQKVIFNPEKFKKFTKRTNNDISLLYNNDKALKEHVDQLYTNDYILTKKYNQLCVGTAFISAGASIAITGLMLLDIYRESQIDDLIIENSRLKNKISHLEFLESEQQLVNLELKNRIKWLEEKINSMEPKYEEDKVMKDPEES